MDVRSEPTALDASLNGSPADRMRRDGGPDDVAGPANGNALPVLFEIHECLTRLAETGAPTTIDLRAMPFGPGDESFLRQALGEGEVTATVTALGPASIVETAYPGVWWVEHQDNSGEPLAKFIEIAAVPMLLAAQDEDVADGKVRLGEMLDRLKAARDGADR